MLEWAEYLKINIIALHTQRAETLASGHPAGNNPCRITTASLCICVNARSQQVWAGQLSWKPMSLVTTRKEVCTSEIINGFLSTSIILAFFDFLSFFPVQINLCIQIDVNQKERKWVAYLKLVFTLPCRTGGSTSFSRPPSSGGTLYNPHVSQPWHVRLAHRLHPLPPKGDA